MATHLDISANTQRIEVDNRFSLRWYYHTAAALLNQASIYRNERNVIELYILLLRFSSLVSDTIPRHRDYRNAPANLKAEYIKKLAEAVSELEALKPEVRRAVERFNDSRLASSSAKDSTWEDLSVLFPSIPKKSVSGNKELQRSGSKRYPDPTTRSLDYRSSSPASSSLDNGFSNLSLNIPRPKDETLSRHSFLAHPLIRRQTPNVPFKAQYPNYINASPIQIPSYDQNWRTQPHAVGASTKSQDIVPPGMWLDADATPLQGNYSTSIGPDVPPVPNIIRQPSPPPVIAPVQTIDAPNHMCAQPAPENVADPRPGPPQHLDEDLGHERGTKHLHISNKMMDEFMALARLNTQKNLETCGVLAGILKKGVFYITTLIIPKQEATSDSCQTVNEEEIFDSQMKRDLLQLGWIHTHPTQTCFMSSIDLHTHYSYQIMLQEAIAIVMAPTDSQRTHGIFRLSNPGGVKTIQECQKRGFHPHEDPPDGSPLCANRDRSDPDADKCDGEESLGQKVWVQLDLTEFAWLRQALQTHRRVGNNSLSCTAIRHPNHLLDRNGLSNIALEVDGTNKTSRSFSR